MNKTYLLFLISILNLGFLTSLNQASLLIFSSNKEKLAIDFNLHKNQEQSLAKNKNYLSLQETINADLIVDLSKVKNKIKSGIYPQQINYSTQKQFFASDCKLVEEQLNGITQIKYEYDSFNRLSVKRYLILNYIETFVYDEEGYLIEKNNNSENGFSIKFNYKNGQLISKSQRYQRLSSPIETIYEYNSAKELVKMAETYISTTTTEFKNGKAIKIENANIKYELNDRGLVLKSFCVAGPKTINIYNYDSSDMLLLQEIYSEPGKKIMYNEYEISKIKKTNLGDEFVENYKGFPVYKNPFGDSKFYVERVANFSTNTPNGLFEKMYEKKTVRTTDNNGNISSALSEKEINTPLTQYIYSGCTK